LLKKQRKTLGGQLFCRTLYNEQNAINARQHQCWTWEISQICGFYTNDFFNVKGQNVDG